MITDRAGKLTGGPLGGYPVIGIAKAREMARSTREDGRPGADPNAEKKREPDVGQAERAGSDTPDTLLTEYAKRIDKPKLFDRDVKTHAAKPGPGAAGARPRLSPDL